MAKTLTRPELYELIWSQPRTTLAKELSVSDVAIGKHCARAHIPAPPPGYWARKKSGKDSVRPALPVRLPGHAGEVTLGESERQRYWSRQVEDLNVPLHPPAFSEEIKQQVSEALKKIGRVSACRDLSKPHQSLKRVLASEALRREKHVKNDWSFNKPYFDAPHHQRQLRIYNGIAHALCQVTLRQEVFIHDEWIQGHGTLHSLKMQVNFGDSFLELEFLEPGDARTSKRAKGVTATTIRVGSEASPLGVQDWVDQPNDKLERQLGDIVTALLNRAERALRAHAHLQFERRVERRRELQAELASAEHAKQVRRQKALAVHESKVRQEIVDLSLQRRTAQDIRDLVAALEDHPDIALGADQLFSDWRDKALSVAGELDPLKRPLPEVLKVFGGTPTHCDS